VVFHNGCTVVVRDASTATVNVEKVEVGIGQRVEMVELEVAYPGFTFQIEEANTTRMDELMVNASAVRGRDLVIDSGGVVTPVGAIGAEGMALSGAAHIPPAGE